MCKRFISGIALTALSIISLCLPSFAETAKSAVITVPAGQTVRVVITSPVSSDTVYLGQPITAVLANDFECKGKVIAPFTSVVYGTALEAKKAVANNPGFIDVRFTQIVTPEGIRVPVSAIIKTKDQTGRILGVSRKASSTAEAEIPVNAVYDLVLTQPITVNPATYSY
jgi:hypothetical protein